MMYTYSETKYFSIKYDDTFNILITTWIIPPTSKEFREELNTLIMAMECYKTGKVIFDARGMGLVLPGDQKWTADNWYERAVKAGYSQVAFVMSSDSFTEMTIKDTTYRQATRIPTAYLYSIEAAQEWLNQF